MNETEKLKRHARRLAILSLFLALGDVAFIVLGAIDARVNYIFTYLEHHGGIILLMLFLLMPVAGLVLGVISFKSTKHQPVLFPVRPWSILGISLSILMTVQVIFAIAIRPQTYFISKEKSCVSNQRELVISICMYRDDNKSLYPQSLTEFKPFLGDDGYKHILKCPDNARVIGYGYNRFVVGLTATDILNPQTILLTADGGDAQYFISSREDIDDRRHELDSNIFNWGFRAPPGFVVGYADGHVSTLKSDTPVQLQPR